MIFLRENTRFEVLCKIGVKKTPKEFKFSNFCLSKNARLHFRVKIVSEIPQFFIEMYLREDMFVFSSHSQQQKKEK